MNAPKLLVDMPDLEFDREIEPLQTFRSREELVDGDPEEQLLVACRAIHWTEGLLVGWLLHGEVGAVSGRQYPKCVRLTRNVRQESSTLIVEKGTLGTDPGDTGSRETHACGC